MKVTVRKRPLIQTKGMLCTMVITLPNGSLPIHQPLTLEKCVPLRHCCCRVMAVGCQLIGMVAVCFYVKVTIQNWSQFWSFFSTTFLLLFILQLLYTKTRQASPFQNYGRSQFAEVMRSPDKKKTRMVRKLPLPLLLLVAINRKNGLSFAHFSAIKELGKRNLWICQWWWEDI